MRRRWKLLIALIVVAWLIISAALVGTAAADAKRGRSALTAAQQNVSSEGLTSGALDAELQRAATLFRRSHNNLNNPLVKPFRLVPVAGRQLSSATALTGTGATVSEVAVDSLRKSRVLADQVETDRAGTLAQLAAIAADANKRIENIDLGPDDALMSELADARNEVSLRVTAMRNGLTRASAGAEGVSKMLSTDSRYLVLAANNGEMRSGSGMFLSAGILQTGGGSLSLGDMETVGDIDAPTGSVSWPKDMDDRWGWIGYKSDLRNLMMSPRFDESAPLAAEIWKKAGKGDVDGVLVIDPATLQAILAATGPVTANGQGITKANVLRTLLIDQYRSIALSGSTAATQNQRREGLSQVASATFAALNEGRWDPAVLARELGRAADGRHILLWAKDGTQNDNWQRAGVSGRMTDNSMMFSSLNVGANKVDQFLETKASVVQVTGRSGIDLSVTVTVTNNAPTDVPRYVLGPGNPNLVSGEYYGLFSFSVPRDATGVRLDDNPHLVALGPDGPSQVIAADARIKRGETKTFVLRFTRPATARVTQVESAARIPATSWTYGADEWLDDHQHLIRH